MGLPQKVESGGSLPSKSFFLLRVAREDPINLPAGACPTPLLQSGLRITPLGFAKGAHGADNHNGAAQKPTNGSLGGQWGRGDVGDAGGIVGGACGTQGTAMAGD